MEVKAKLRFARVGAQKARPFADMVRGKSVNESVKMLAGFRNKTAEIMKKLIESGVANAVDRKVIDVDNLYVKHISVDMGPTMKRFRPRAQGRASGIKKKMSHFNLILDER